MILEFANGVIDLLETDVQEWLQSKILPDYVKRRRWFASKNKIIQSIRIKSCCPVAFDEGEMVLCEIEIDMEGRVESYQLHLGLCVVDGHETALTKQLKLADVMWQHRPAYLTDAFALDVFAYGFLKTIQTPLVMRCQNAIIKGVPQEGRTLARYSHQQTLKRISAEQSNSSLIIGDDVIMKLIRRIMPGINPEVEMVRYLTEQNYANTPPLLGEIQRHTSDGSDYSMVVLQKFIPNLGDGWEFTLNFLATVRTDFGGYASFAAAIGKRLAELHAVLALASEAPAFEAQQAGEADVGLWADGASKQILEAVAVLQEAHGLDEQAEHDRRFVLDHINEISAFLPLLAHSGLRALLTRVHGDFHLGQVLVTDTDAYIIDFEGEPAKPLEVRRSKSSPLRDVAGLLRSLDYAAAASAGGSPEFVQSASQSFLAAYRDVAHAAHRRWVVDDTQELALLDLFLLEKSAYEICYEASNRPTWLAIPLRGFAGIVRRVLGPPPETFDA